MSQPGGPSPFPMRAGYSALAYVPPSPQRPAGTVALLVESTGQVGPLRLFCFDAESAQLLFNC